MDWLQRHWRTVLLDIPAAIVKGLFTCYWFFLALMTLLLFLNTLLYLMAWAAGRPLLWAH